VRVRARARVSVSVRAAERRGERAMHQALRTHLQRLQHVGLEAPEPQRQREELLVRQLAARQTRQHGPLSTTNRVWRGGGGGGLVQGSDAYAPRCFRWCFA
jgi:hypothetical protein